MIFNSSDLPPMAIKKLSDCEDAEVLRIIAQKLWALLDDIDTYDDMIKPSSQKSLELYRIKALEASYKRHDLLLSDGYELFLPPKG